jgi:DNA ligase-1
MDEPIPLLAGLARAARDLQSTTKRLEKRAILADYLRGLPDAALPLGVTYLSGRPFPRHQNRRLSIGGAVFNAAVLSARPGLTEAALYDAWLRHSDASDVAHEVWAGTPEGGVTLYEVSDFFERLFSARGPSKKTPLLAGALGRMGAEEARAFVKILSGETRMGVQEGTLEDAVAAAFNLPLDEVRAANRHRADLGAVALEARHGALETHVFNYFTTVDPMLASAAADTDEVIRRLGAPVWVEDKYDGVRCQLHKVEADVRLFSRDRKDITRQFPDIAAAFAALPGTYALDGEALGIENGRSLPFIRLQQRLNRVAPAAEDVAANPVALVAFDILADGGQSLLDMPLAERRTRLEALALPRGQHLAPVAFAETAADLDALFLAARERGNEGLMCKDPASLYTSGRRGHAWLKVKRALDTLDCVIVGAEWGHGKRRGVLSDYSFAVRDDLGDRGLVTLGKAYNGLTDVEIAAMTETLLAITVQEFGRYRTVKPEIVMEVAFENIQKSARHGSGYALRFPRFVRIRTDKTVDQINTLSDVAAMYGQLTGAGGA